MFGFGKHGPDARYGAIIDIGSGSVGVAIIVSEPNEKKPVIIWSYRERIPTIRGAENTEASKSITTALINAILVLGSEGTLALKSYDKKASIEILQVSIAAPWSYTITKTVSYQKDEDFEVTKRLVRELIETAQKEALEAIDENDIIKKLGLEVINRATIDISANDYHTGNAFGQQAKRLSISHVSAIAQKKLLDAATEAHEKVLPKATLERYSFMLIFYCVLRQLHPNTSEICLVDVTNESTEIGIVRDGILRYVTHSPVGIFTIAREIASLCEIPIEEAVGYVRGNTSLEKTLTSTKLADIKAVIASYETTITALFKRTGDQLSIPRPIFIHTDDRCENFFAAAIKNAASKATKSEHGIHLVTSKLLEEDTLNDSALLLSAYFFHKLHGCDGFEQV